MHTDVLLDALEGLIDARVALATSERDDNLHEVEAARARARARLRGALLAYLTPEGPCPAPATDGD